MTGWQFPSNDSKEEEGLADAGIETFMDAPLSGIARESSQNSMDAALSRWGEPGAEPVHIVFSLHNLDAKEIPGLDQLRLSLESCLAKALERKRTKEITFFTQALTVAKKAKIPVLCVEDYATTGLRGPDKEGFPFHALVRATGISQKTNNEAGGSFGIGKNAAFAISGLHTVFYSTRYQDKGEEKVLVQGKAILISRNEDGREVRAKGYWGEQGYLAVNDPRRIPAWLVRSEIGTTVASVGFDGSRKNWAVEITESLVRNFFAAIHEGRVRFTVEVADGKAIKLDSKLLGKLFEHEQVLAAAEEGCGRDEFLFSAALFSALTATGDEVVECEKEFPHLGTIRLRVLQREGMPKRVGILRNGMYITDNLEKFGERFIKFPLSRDFVAVVEPADTKASANLREMENPRHDAFSDERIEDEKRRPKLRKDMVALGKWIRSVVREQTREVVKEKIQLEELSDFFAGPDENEQMPDQGKAGKNPERITVKPVQLVPRPAVGAGPGGDDGSAGGQKAGGKKTGITSGKRKGKGRGAVGGRGGKSVVFGRFRNMLGDRDGLLRTITFVPEETAKARVELVAVGVSSDEPLSVMDVEGAQGGKSFVLSLNEGEPVELKVRLKEAYKGPVRMVLAKEVNKEELIDEN